MPSFLNENNTVKKFWILFEENMVAIFYVKLLLYNLFYIEGTTLECFGLRSQFLCQ